jgi:hypothetical protein
MTDVKRASNHEANERNEPGQRFDGVVPYIRGSGWATTATVDVDDAPANPWSKQHWNLTHQVQIYKRDQTEANRLAQLAGHKDALSARAKNAR